MNFCIQVQRPLRLYLLRFFFLNHVVVMWVSCQLGLGNYLLVESSQINLDRLLLLQMVWLMFLLLTLVSYVTRSVKFCTANYHCWRIDMNISSTRRLSLHFALMGITCSPKLRLL